MHGLATADPTSRRTVANIYSAGLDCSGAPPTVHCLRRMQVSDTLFRQNPHRILSRISSAEIPSPIGIPYPLRQLPLSGTTPLVRAPTCGTLVVCPGWFALELRFFPQRTEWALVDRRLRPSKLGLCPDTYLARGTAPTRAVMRAMRCQVE